MSTPSLSGSPELCVQRELARGPLGVHVELKAAGRQEATTWEPGVGDVVYQDMRAVCRGECLRRLGPGRGPDSFFVARDIGGRVLQPNPRDSGKALVHVILHGCLIKGGWESVELAFPLHANERRPNEAAIG